MAGLAPANPLCAALLDKIVEQIERTEHLISLLPEGSVGWKPSFGGAWTVSELLRHLVECVKGFCAVLYAVEPERLAHLQALRSNEVMDVSVIVSSFREINDATLSRRIPSVFSPLGETVLSLFLNNLEHLINHKHQLFTYLRLLGVPAGSSDLYRFRNIDL